MCTKTFGMFIYSFQGVKGLASLSCFGGSKTPKNRNKKQAMEGGGWCQSQFSPIFLPSSSLKKNKAKVPGIRPLLPALLHKLFLMLQSRFETAQDVSKARENYLKKTGIRGPFIYPFYCNTSKTRTTTRNRPGQIHNVRFPHQKSQSFERFWVQLPCFLPPEKNEHGTWKSAPYWKASKKYASKSTNLQEIWASKCDSPTFPPECFASVSTSRVCFRVPFPRSAKVVLVVPQKFLWFPIKIKATKNPPKLPETVEIHTVNLTAGGA